MKIKYLQRTRRYSQSQVIDLGMGREKKVKPRETFRLDQDVQLLFQAALDATGADKGRVLNEAVRLNLPAVVDALLKKQQDREQGVAEVVKQIRAKKPKP